MTLKNRCNLVAGRFAQAIKSRFVRGPGVGRKVKPRARPAMKEEHGSAVAGTVLAESQAAPMFESELTLSSGYRARRNASLATRKSPLA